MMVKICCKWLYGRWVNDVCDQSEYIVRCERVRLYICVQMLLFLKTINSTLAPLTKIILMKSINNLFLCIALIIYGYMSLEQTDVKLISPILWFFFRRARWGTLISSALFIHCLIFLHLFILSYFPYGILFPKSSVRNSHQFCSYRNYLIFFHFFILFCYPYGQCIKIFLYDIFQNIQNSSRFEVFDNV